MKKKMSTIMSLFMVVLMISVVPVSAADVGGSISPTATIELTDPSGGDFISGTYMVKFDKSADFTESALVKYARLSITGDATCNDVTSWTDLNTISHPGESSSWDTTTDETPDAADYCLQVADATGVVEDRTTAKFTIDNTDPVIASVEATTEEEADDIIVVTFVDVNGMDKTSTENADNWVVESPNDEMIIDDNADFDYNSEDNTLTITLDESVDGTWLKDTDNVCVTPSNVEDVAGNTLASTEKCSATIGGDNDNNKPTVDSVTFEHANTDISEPFPAGVLTITATFNEDIDPDDAPFILIDRPGTDDNADVAVEMDMGVDRETWTYDYTIEDDDDEGVLDGTASITISDADDLAGNTMDDDMSVTFGIDTIDPEVNELSVSDDLINEDDVDGDDFVVTVEYSEDMDESVDPTFTFTPDVSTTLTGCTGSWEDSDIYEYSCTVADNDIEVTEDDVTVEDGIDLAGNMHDDFTGDNMFEVDTREPVGTISVDTDPVYEGDLVLVVTIDYDEDMAAASIPTISFDGNNGAITTQGDGTWTDDDTWTETFDVTDADEESTVTVSSEDATDVAGNDEDTDDENFEVDTLQPTITDVDNVDFLFVDRGNDVLVTVTFSEDMDTTIDPSIDPDVTETGDDAPAWVIQNIVWDDATTITFEYVVPDSDVGLLADTSFTIEDAEDVAGNVMNDHVEATTIDTDQPTGEVSVDTDPVYEGDLVQVVTVDYDEDMDTDSTPTISFDGNTGAITSQSDGSWDDSDTWTETFNVADADEGSDVTVSSSGATDVSGNVEDASDTTGFEIDTAIPYVSDGPTPADDTVTNDVDQDISVDLADDESGIDGDTIVMTVESVSYDTGDDELDFDGETLTFTPSESFTDGQIVDVIVDVDDDAGNSLDTLEFSFLVDTTDPESLAVEVSPNDPEINQFAQVTGLATDDNGVRSAMLVFDGEEDIDDIELDDSHTADGSFGDESETITYMIDTTGWDVGTYFVSLLAYDGANWEEPNSDNTDTFVVLDEGDGDGGDDDAPFIVDSSPGGINSTSTHSLRVQTSEDAQCRYGDKLQQFDDLPNEMTVFGENGFGVLHSDELGALSDGNYNYFVGCQDDSENTVNFMISFRVDTTGNFDYVQSLNINWNTLWLPEPSLLAEMMDTDKTNEDLALENVLDPSLEENYDVVWYNVDGTENGWLWFVPEDVDEDAHDASTLTHANNVNDKPYWIDMDSSDRFEVGDGGDDI